MDAKTILDLPYFLNLFKNLIVSSGYSTVLKQLVTQQVPDIPDAHADKVVHEAVQYICESFKNVWIKKYNEHFTSTELQQLYDFYNTPLALKASDLSLDFAQALADWVERNKGAIKNLITRELTTA